MRRIICAVDQGTTGTTVLLLDEALRPVARETREFAQIYPRPSWVEHDPEAIWRSTLDTIGAAIGAARIAPREVACVGITNQRETTVVWDRASGAPIHNAIVWQDRRTAERIRGLRAEGQRSVHERTGLILDPYFSGTKIEWILDHVDGARARAERGELAFGTIDTFLLWRLTGGAAHKTDVSNASRTLLMDLRRGAWDDELLELLRVPRALLPEIVESSTHLGEVRDVPGLADGTPVCGMAGDQQAALFGQACFEPGAAKCTYGTGAFLLLNTGPEPVISGQRLLTTAAWRRGGVTTYALEGSAFVAGAMVQWLRDGLGIIDSAAEIEALARSVDSADGVVAVPALAGLGAPHWNPEARGVLSGLTRGTTRAHVARAVLEGIALQNVDILAAMERDAGAPLAVLKVDGGASRNDLLMQLQADFLGTRIERPALVETTALGAALLAGLAAGVFDDLDAVRAAWRAEATFEPRIDAAARAEHLARWARALGRV